MKLLVIIICLFLVRYVTHPILVNRFFWFNGYRDFIGQQLQWPESLLWLKTFTMVVPVPVCCGLLLYFFERTAYGLVYFLGHVALLLYCIGPDNPFVMNTGKKVSPDHIKQYLALVNRQLFTVIFLYITTGPVCILIYRLLTVYFELDKRDRLVEWLVDYSEWSSARITAVCYALIGNFQPSFRALWPWFLSYGEHNNDLLAESGLAALSGEENVSADGAQMLVTHAIILCLVIFASWTIMNKIAI